MTKKAKSTSSPSLTRYALIGGALGLYFGWFFRPGPDGEFRIFTIFLLATIIATVMTAIFVWRERPSFSKIPVRFASLFVKAAIILSVLEARNLVYGVGGKTAVIIFTVIMGVLSGLWYGYEQKRLKQEN